MKDKIIESLRDYRDDKGMSDQKLAKLLGVHYNSIYNWLTLGKNPGTLARQIIKRFLIKNL